MNLIILPTSVHNQQEYLITEPAIVKHLQNILSVQVGDTLKIGCLCGNLGTAKIALISSKGVQLSHIFCNQLPPAKQDLTIILALPRPKVLRRLIMDMTAIGVAHIVLVKSARTDKSYWQSPMLNRIDEFILEGLQQGVDTIPPTVSMQKRFKPFVEDDLSKLAKGKRTVVAHPYAIQSLSDYDKKFKPPQMMCIGAEGGWVDFEVELFKRQGCHVVAFGTRILRTEAAVNVLCGRYI